MKTKNTDKLFDRWINNPNDQFSFDELNELLQNIDKDSESKHIDDFFAENWEKAGQEKEGNEFNQDCNYQAISQFIRKKEQREDRKIIEFKVRNAFTFISKVAAILILPMVLMILLDNGFSKKTDNFISNVEYFSPPASRTHIFLPDSSEVWLNSNSKLEVMHGYGKGERGIKLTGEAYFSVKKDKKTPFNVYAQGISVRVHGTKFNISAYEDQDSVETVLLSGSISLKYTQYPGDQGILMVPDQRINYYKQADSVRSDFVDSQAYCSWKDGILVFYDSPMAEVTKKLERWFNVNIIIKDEMLLNYRITGTLKDRSLDQIMKFISLTSPIDYIQEGDNIYMTKR